MLTKTYQELEAELAIAQLRVQEVTVQRDRLAKLVDLHQLSEVWADQQVAACEIQRLQGIAGQRDKLALLWAGFMQVVRDAEWCMFEVDLSDFMDEIVVKQCGFMTYEEWDEVKHGPDGLDIEGDEGDMIYVLTDQGKALEQAGHVCDEPGCCPSPGDERRAQA